MAWWAYMGAASAIDHSDFKVNYFFDASHHYAHHRFIDCNYSEFEILDVLFGTKKRID